MNWPWVSRRKYEIVRNAMCGIAERNVELRHRHAEALAFIATLPPDTVPDLLLVEIRMEAAAQSLAYSVAEWLFQQPVDKEAQSEGSGNDCHTHQE